MTGRHTIFGPLLALVLFVPLPFASVLPWTWTTVGACVALLLAAWSIAIMIRREVPSVPLRRIRLPAILFGLTVLWVLIQVSPWTPESWHHPIWKEAAAVLRAPLQGRITVDPFRTTSTLLRLLTYAAVFWLALQFGRDRELARMAIAAIAIAGALYAAYGLVIFFGGNEMVLWVKKTAYSDSLTSTFINKNSYATYAGIGLICMTCTIFRLTMQLQTRQSDGRERLRVISSELIGRGWPLLLAWMMIATALFLTNSRAGVISSAIALVVFLASHSLSPYHQNKVGRLPAVIILVAGLIFFFISGDSVTDRLFGVSVQADARLAVYEMTFQAISDSPILGMGYGTFDQIFELYRGDTEKFRFRFAKAHNTYLENVMELGIPAACALLVANLLIVANCVIGIRRRRRDVLYPMVGLAVSVLVAVHALVDFSLQNPAVAITYSFILGLACAQSWSSRSLAESRPRPVSSEP